MNSKANGVVNGDANGLVEHPDPDYIKMFVGQIPRSMDEEQLRTMFEEYGRVHKINVLRDKVTGLSKGKYSFFTFFRISLCCKLYARVFVSKLNA